MICRHQPGDPNCSSSPNYIDPYRSESRTKTEYIYVDKNNPDSKEYYIEQVESIGKNVVLKVRYPSCSKCAYEGNKVLVYLNLDIKNIIFWREIDPHFKDPKRKISKSEAPAPDARFPASEKGWNDALEWARIKDKGK